MDEFEEVDKQIMDEVNKKIIAVLWDHIDRLVAENQKLKEDLATEMAISQAWADNWVRTWNIAMKNNSTVEI